MLPYGAIWPFCPICLDSNDFETVHFGFRQRLMRQLPEPDQQVLMAFRDFVRSRVREIFHPCTAMTFEEWLASTTYPEQRKEQLRTAFQDLRGGLPTRRQCQHVDTFVKTEFYPEYKHCRMINSRCDAFKAFSGPYFKSIEQMVYQDKWFVKHVPVPDRPLLVNDLRQAGRKYYATDFTAYESHFTPQILDICECELYRFALSNYPAVASLICETLMGVNRMRTRAHVSAEVRGRRMSGDMCTSLGNGFTNKMLAEFIVHCKGGTIDGLVEGDDGLFSSTVPLTSEDYLKLGFTIKIEQVDDPRQASFCGLIFTESGQIVRDPFKFLSGFGWTSSFISAGTGIMMQLLRAKALSAVYETPHCPIIGVLARRALDVTRGCAPRFVDDGYHTPHDESSLVEFSPCSATRELFALKFGISVETQLMCEALIASGREQEVAALLQQSGGPRSCDREHYYSRYVECC